MTKLITCASFYGSGSSAFTDLVSEYNGVKSMSNYEFRFLHDIDGVSDLEFHLVENHNRHNAGHALKRFIKLSKFNAGESYNRRYEPFFNNQYAKLTRNYIEALTDFSYKGWWFYDLFDGGGTMHYYAHSLAFKVLSRLNMQDFFMKNVIQYCSHPSLEKFLKCTRDYTKALIEAGNKEKAPYLMIDQILPSSNLKRYLRYLTNETFVFIVDRDPRDVYVSAKFLWKDRIVPTDTVENFCKWFRYTREAGNREELDSSNVMRIQFEDIIYKYEYTRDKVISFIGLKEENHISPFALMNPKHSAMNTQLWKKYDILREIEFIESELGNYLYDFDSVAGIEVPGIVLENMKSF